MSANINKTQQKKWKIFSKINENLLSKFSFWYGSTSKFHTHKNQYLRKIPLKAEKNVKSDVFQDVTVSHLSPLR